MSLFDLVSIATACDFRPTNQMTPTERRTAQHMRWLNKPGNRAKFNAYRRKWWAARKERA